MFLWSLFAILIIIFDQLTKILVVQNITLNSGDVLVIPEMFSFVHVHNPGAAFSILQGKIELLSCISLAFCVGVIWYMLIRKPQNKVLRISTMLLFAGAIGNVLENLQCSSDLRGTTVEVDPGEIDFGSAFCSGEKNRAFYSIITAEELNTLYEN